MYSNASNKSECDGSEPDANTVKLLRTLSDSLILEALKAGDIARPSHEKSASRVVVDLYKQLPHVTSDHCPAQLHGWFQTKGWKTNIIFISPPCSGDPTLGNYAHAGMVRTLALVPNGLLKMEMRILQSTCDIRSFESIDAEMWTVLHKLAGSTSAATSMIDNWRKAYSIFKQAIKYNSIDPRKLELAEQAISVSPLCTAQ